MKYNVQYRVYTRISENLLLYEKRFGFQQKYSKEIYESLEKKEFTRHHLSKAFDTVYHDIY